MRVFVAESDGLCRDGVIQAIDAEPDFELIGTASDGREALHRITALKPDVALLSQRLPGLEGMQLLGALRRDGVATEVVLFSSSPESAKVYAAIASGAAGYISSSSTGEELRETVSEVAGGSPSLSQDLHRTLMEEIRARATELDAPTLSDTDTELLEMAADGHSIAVMARQVNLAPGTVKNRLQRVYDKLGARDRANAVAEGMRRGLIK